MKETNTKVILDTDIGDDIDDAYAVALLTSAPGIKILGVTTTFGETRERAELAARLLKVAGREDIPVIAGRRGDARIHRQYEWARGFQSGAVKSGEAVEFMRHEIERAPGQVTIIGIGPLTNIGDLFTRYPETAPKIKSVVIMGGAVHVGYNNQAPPTPEWNIRCDVAAARSVFTSGAPLTMAGLEATTMMSLDPERQKQVFAHGARVTDALAALTVLWGSGVPTLFDPVAVAYALGHHFCDTEERHVTVEDDGLTRITEGRPNVTVLINPRKDEFLDWYVSALKGKP